MNRTTVLAVVCILAASVVLSACCGGGSTQVVTKPAPATTLGQELTDLETAHDKGVITDKEYEDAKQKLIKERTGK